MLLSNLVLGAALVAGDPQVEVSIPDVHVSGEPFVVELTYLGGDAGAALEAWRIGAAAFELNGAPLAERATTDVITLPKGASLTLRVDLAGYLEAPGSFELAVAGGGENARASVKVLAAAAEGLDFTTMPVEDLDDYVVLLRTNKGSMMVEFRPDLAPNHVRNYLDLAYTGFYDGVLFHRVSPTFMIQGGCPNTKTDRTNTWGTGRGPRMLEPEFTQEPHVRGVLSMARGNPVNSASSQFFIMTADSRFLDNKYSVFGRLVSGWDTLDRIASAQGKKANDGTSRPKEPQRIEAAKVLSRPEN